MTPSDNFAKALGLPDDFSGDDHEAYRAFRAQLPPEWAMVSELSQLLLASRVTCRAQQAQISTLQSHLQQQGFMTSIELPWRLSLLLIPVKCR